MPIPGSFVWLLVHDIRLNWRRFTHMLGDAGPRLLIAIFVGGGLLLHLVALPLVPLIGPLLHGGDAAARALALFIGCTFSWMVAQSLFGATRTLYDRGDLDLLLGSPIPACRVIAAKAVAIAASVLGSLALLILPIANVGALTDRLDWLTVYPLLLALALGATSIGIALSIALFFVFGARRARTYTQMTGAVIGGVFVLTAQVVAMLPASLRQGIAGWLDESSGAPAAGVRSWLWLPVDAVQGNIGVAMGLAAIAGLMLLVVVWMLGERFARASLAAAGAASGGPASRSAGARHVFRAGLGRCLRRKEWRLLVRDPSLFAQIGLQIIYTIPIAVVLLRSESLPAALAIAPTIVVIASQVAASLAWITVSGEDAPELIATAPVSAAAVDRGKLGAIVLPVLLIVAVPLAGLALISWRSAILAALCAAGGSVSTSLLNFWHPMPGNRRGMLRRHSQSKLIGLVEHGLAVLWAVATIFALFGSWLTVVPVAMAAGVVALCRHRQGQPTASSPSRAKVAPRHGGALAGAAR